MRPFGTTIFAEMSALAVRTGAVNLGPGLPRHRRARRRCSPPRPRRCAAGTTSTRPAPASPTCAPRSPRTSAGSGASTYDPDGEVLITAGATEAIAAAILALCEPGDEVVCFEPYYDSYAASIALAGAVRRPVTLRPGDDGRYALRPRRAARRVRPAHPAGAAQLTAQPDRQGLHPRRAGADRRAVPGARRVRGHRRGLRAPRLHRRGRAAHAAGRPCPACASARCGSPRPARPSPAPAGRSAGPAARPRWSSAVDAGQAVPDLRQRRAAAAGRRGRAGLPDATSTVPRRPAGAAGPAGRRADRGRLRASCRPEGTYFVTADITAARRHATASSSAARCPSAAAWWPCRPRSSTTTRGRAAAGPVRLLQAPRGPRRGGAPAARARRAPRYGRVASERRSGGQRLASRRSMRRSATVRRDLLGRRPRPSPGPAARCPTGAAAPGRSRPSSASACGHRAGTAGRGRAGVRSADRHVDQHLRQLGHHRGELGQRPAGRRHPGHQVQPGEHAVAGGRVRRHDDVPALLAAEREPAGAQLLQHVPVADRGLDQPDARPRASPAAGRGCSSRWRPACPRSACRPPASPAPGSP